MEKDKEVKKINECPEFPYFGARYPDARCIDGNLHDMDNCDEHGNLYANSGDDPCPFCRTDEYIERHTEDCDGDGNEVTVESERERILNHIEFLRKRYGSNP